MKPMLVLCGLVLLASIRSAKAASFGLAFLISGGLLTPAMAGEPTAFESCVDREAPSAFGSALVRDRSAALYGSNSDVINDVLNKCIPALGGQLLTDRDHAIVEADVLAEAQVALAKKEAEDTVAQQSKEAIAAEKEKLAQHAEDAATAAYYSCLKKHAHELSGVSSEVATVIAQASFASCPAERKTAFDAIHNHYPILDAAFMDTVDSKLEKSLVLEIIKYRARSSVPSHTGHKAPNI